MLGEDITFCANKSCSNMDCKRNPNHIKLAIPHSFSLFMICENWSDEGAKWLTDQIPEYVEMYKTENGYGKD